MSKDREQAALLTEQAANALSAARNSLRSAADVAEEVGTTLRRSENDLAELSGQATKVRFAEEPGRHLRNATELADDVDRRLRTGQQGLAEVRDHLDQSGRTLDVGRQFLTELEHLPDRPAGATDRLRQRLDGLRGAVRNATADVEEVGRRLAAARRTVEPLVYSSSRVDDPGRAAAFIDETGTGVQGDVSKAHRQLAGVREDLDHTGPNATAAAYESAELATAARAALNPTSASARRVATGTSELDLRRRGTDPTQAPARER